MNDPFFVLGVSESADDDEVKRRYLALVRAFPPERDPERFQAIRAAFEVLRTARGRLEQRLLRSGVPGAGDPGRHRTGLAGHGRGPVAGGGGGLCRSGPGREGRRTATGDDRQWGRMRAWTTPSRMC